jgi:hypothetical protein
MGRINGKSINKSVRIPHELDAIIWTVAKDEGRTYGGMVRYMLLRYIKIQKGHRERRKVR